MITHIRQAWCLCAFAPNSSLAARRTRGHRAASVLRLLCASMLAALALSCADQAPAEKKNTKNTSDSFLVKTAVAATATRDERAPAVVAMNIRCRLLMAAPCCASEAGLSRIDGLQG
jgi:hypothetical protein